MPAQLTIELPSGETLYLPAQMAIDETSTSVDLPSTVIPGRDGERVYRHLKRLEPRTITVSGNIVGTPDGQLAYSLSKADLDTIVRYWKGLLVGQGPLKLWRYTGAPEYISVDCQNVRRGYARGHHSGALAEITMTFVAKDPFWYRAERVVDTVYCGPSFRAEAEEPNHPSTGNQRIKVDFRGSGWALQAIGSASSGEEMRTLTVGDYVEVTFFGTGIVLGFSTASNRGIASILIDGAAPSSNPTLDQYAASAAYQQTAAWTGLAAGRHTFRATVSGTKNGASSNYYLDADFFDVIGTDLVIEDNAGTAESDAELFIEPAEREWALDFLGKSAGSVVENKHAAYQQDAAADPAPTLPGSWTELIAADYTAIKYRDDSRYSNATAVNTNYGYLMLSFDLASINADVTNLRTYTRKLDLYLAGLGYSPANTDERHYDAKVYARNRTTGAWVEQTDADSMLGLTYGRTNYAWDRYPGIGDPAGFASNAARKAANIPRYDWGKFHNLLTTNQSDVETDTTGFGSTGATPTRVVTGGGDGDAWEGTGFLKVVTDNAGANEGVFTIERWGPLGSKTLTGSVYLRGAGTVIVQIVEYDSAGVTIGSTSSAVVTLTGTWTRYSVSRAFAANGVQAAIRVWTDVQQGITFYCDGFQLEMNSSAHAFMKGGTHGAGMAILSEYNYPNKVANGEDLTGWTDSGACTATDAGGDVYGHNLTLLENGAAANDYRYKTLAGGTFTVTAPVLQFVAKQKPLTLVSKFQLYDTVAAASRILGTITWATRVIALTNGTLVGVEWLANDTVRYYVKPSALTVANAHELRMYASDTAVATEGTYWTAVQMQDIPFWQSYNNGTVSADKFTIPVYGLFPDPLHWTIEMWAYVDDNVKTQNTITPRLFEAACSGSGYLRLIHSGTTAFFVLQVANAAGNSSTLNIADASLPTGWHHIAIVTDYANREMDVLIDGALAATLTGLNSTVPFPTFLDQGAFGVGSSTTGTANWRSLIDSIRISNYEKTAAEIATYYAGKAAFTREAGTVYYNNFTDNYAADRSGGSLYTCPWRRTLSSGITDYIDDTGKVHVLVKAAYPSDGVTSSITYLDHARLVATRAYTKLGTECVTNRRQLVRNSSFELATEWTGIGTYRRRGEARQGLGDYFVRVTYATGLYQSVAVQPGLSYRVGVFVRNYSTAYNVEIYLQWYNAAGVLISASTESETLTAEWAWVTSATYTAPSNAVSLRVTPRVTAGSADTALNGAEIDGVTIIQESTAPGGWIDDEEQILTLSAAVELAYGTELQIDSFERVAIASDATDYSARLNVAFLCDGLLIKPDKNYLELACEGDDLFNLRLRYQPRSY